MQKIKIVAVGKIKEKFLQDAFKEYHKRLGRYCDLRVVEKDDAPDSWPLSKVLTFEADQILKNLNKDDYVILCDLHGKHLSSEDFAQKIKDLSFAGITEVVFVIGGSWGLADVLRQRANFALALSKLTFTHQFSRIILVEQLFRAFKINAEEKYHK